MKRLTTSLKKFCEKEGLLRVAWIDSEGYPRVAPVWFVVMGGRYYFATGASSAKWKAMQRNPRVGWVIDGGKGRKYKGASMCGRAEEVSDSRLRRRIYRALGLKYFGSVTDSKFVEIYGGVDDPDTAYIRLTPIDGVCWEY
ncbi:MAG TPA: pyridoxamine 5'-phosphate oxidase family protein [Blastocatellia bacterium]|nr:pyridoxamine 5'-phosphate oxidase family protein [Blastocatellia bacterium]